MSSLNENLTVLSFAYTIKHGIGKIPRISLVFDNVLTTFCALVIANILWMKSSLMPARTIGYKSIWWQIGGKNKEISNVHTTKNFIYIALG